MEISVACEVIVHLTIDKKQYRLSKAEAEKLIGALQQGLREQTGAITVVSQPIDNGESGRNNYGPWSRTDEMTLRQHLVVAGRPIENVARLLRRTVASCEKKCDDLGIILRDGRWHDAIAEGTAD